MKIKLGLEERFWSKVNRAGPDKCWEWKASKGPDGYGAFRLTNPVTGKRRMNNAQRVAYYIEHKEWPQGKTICHRCDNPSCCNPDHLFAGTQADNVYDMVSKGRQRGVVRLGSESSNSKLTESDVVYIRGCAANGIRQRAIAQELSISEASVSLIVHRKLWKHI